MAATIVVTIEDAKGASSTMEVNVPSTFTLAQMQGAAQDIADIVDALTGGVITNVGINVAVDISALGLKASAQVSADVEEGARFIWRVVGGFITSFRIPTFLESLILDNTKQVDLEDPLVDALVDAIVDGTDVGGTPITFVDKRSTDIVALASAQEDFQRSR